MSDHLQRGNKQKHDDQVQHWWRKHTEHVEVSHMLEFIYFPSFHLFLNLWTCVSRISYFISSDRLSGVHTIIINNNEEEQQRSWTGARTEKIRIKIDFFTACFRKQCFFYWNVFLMLFLSVSPAANQLLFRRLGELCCCMMVDVVQLILLVQLN